MRYRVWGLIALLGLGSGTGCIQVHGRQDLDDLSRELRDVERARTLELAAVERRLDDVEQAQHRVSGYLAGSAARRAAAEAAGPGQASAAPDGRGGAGDASPDAPRPTSPAPGGAAAAAASAASGPAEGRSSSSSGAGLFVEAEAASEATYGGTSRQALGVDPPNLDPARMQDTTSTRIGVQVFETLVTLDPELNVVGQAAESWQISEDGRTYTFRLKPGLKFHNGRPVTAEDFRYSFARILDPATASVRVWILDRALGYPLFAAYRRMADAARAMKGGEYPNYGELDGARNLLERVDQAYIASLGHPDPTAAHRLAQDLVSWLSAPDPHRAAALATRADGLRVQDFLGKAFEAPAPDVFVVRLSEPLAPFLQMLTMIQTAVVPREVVEELGNDFSFRPVGSGPFRFVSWQHDVKIELEANSDYHGGRPYLDAIELRIIPDLVTQLTEFEVGNLDVVTRIPDEKYEALKADSAYPGVLEEALTMHVFFLAMNPQQAPFHDVRIRRAFNHAIDRAAILSKIRKGRGLLARGVLPPMLPSFDPELPTYDFDPDKARALLAEAGYDPPSELGPVQFWYNSSTGSDVNAKIAEVFQENLRQIGVDLRLNSVDWGTYLEKIRRCEPPILRLAWVASFAEADNFLWPFFHSHSIGQTNVSCLEDPRVDDLLERARRTTDQAGRIALYRKAERRVMDQALWIPLFHSRDAIVRKDHVRGLVLNARGADDVRYHRVWHAED